ncbi:MULTISPECIES: histidine--tRNA ligase [unclassified Treponema]|uniref:histidine--tRNA ligase n=1 Tax=unclassified Treponema TaxID=2638727 RepID=UPI0020A3CAFA|nr:MULTISPECIES: histidine--tRNA ligase [unclassified Treponema]UTC68186.1 histidine--tRNA ligase [Treponema sp. OMZ 789]UTC70906.1 histidine--tRNA ligase [Treponema sp. OMZ 790]UTC73646.1 histidine--tRNA ligase [Treponema sp. OMZ 791]
MSDLIQPKVLKGFRDFLPADEIERALLMEKLVKIFRDYGFVPIDTPALEYSEILLRKSGGETEKQVFRFNDNGGRDVAMRFDLTVPLARFIAEHRNEIYFPFKRYHLGKVWRGEKPQAGRYREFLQCDFDILGSDTAAVDFEILRLIKKSLNELGVSNFKIHVSHRGVFNRFLQSLNLSGDSEEILRIVDKLAKVGESEVLKLLSELSSEEKAKKILDYISGANKELKSEDFEKTLLHLEALAGGASEDTKRIKDIYSLVKAVGIEDSIVFDPSITRGLDYYTGVVFETFLTDLPSIGSICSGGRYDNLTGLYMKESITGVGASIGLDRLLAALEQLEHPKTKASFTDLLIFSLPEDSQILSYKISNFLETQKINSEVYPEPKKMNHQYAYAEKKDIRWGLFLTKDSCVEEFDRDMKNYKVRLKDMTNRTEDEMPLGDAVKKVIASKN